MAVSRLGPLRELTLVALGFAALTVVLTYPLALQPGSLGRTDNADGQFAIWNVAWVARTLIADPLHLLDANIFHPHRWTLAYSEANFGAGLVAAPVYWLTRNPYAAFNAALLLSFVASGIGTYYLLRYLAHDRRAACIGAIGFAFCPYLFGHIPHIQLLMTAGLPFTLLAFHRFADQPRAGRAVALGLTLTLQTLFCAYYGVFAVLIVGYAVLFTATSRRLWREAAYWKAVLAAAGVAVVSVLPVALPYLLLQRESGFARSLDAAREYSAGWRMYLLSNAYLHRPIAAFAGGQGELLFPGFVAILFAVYGALRLSRAQGRSREHVVFYLSLAALAFWVSLGPSGGLYSLLYSTVPGFTFMRAPSRAGLVVPLALLAVAGMGLAALLERSSRPALLSAALALFAIADVVSPLRLSPAPPIEPVYRTLATLPRGPLIELPVYSHQFRFLRARYMLSSTMHWMPLVNAYSDFIPPDFQESLPLIADFPSRQAFARLERDGVRYAVFHLEAFTAEGARAAVLGRIAAFAPYLRRLDGDERTV
ncbi:MAG: hypothetical protein A3H97_00040, partial [Acidobacteria bacterium RIFCSPLOWO2_02_FULL_65_29]